MKFFVRSLWDAGISLFFLVTILFFLVRVMPGGPFDSNLKTPPEVKLVLSEKYGLERPLVQQYFRFVGQFVTLDFGESIHMPGRKVSEVIWQKLPVSAELGSLAFLFSLSASLLIVTIVRFFPSLTVSFYFVTAVLSASPVYILAAILIACFAVYIPVFPIAFWSSAWHKVLPVVTLSLPVVAKLSRVFYQILLQESKQDYTQVAYAKGFSDWQVYWRHVFKNAAIPLLPMLAVFLANLLVGSFAVEYVFEIPGVSSYFIYSMLQRDYPMIIGLSFCYGSLLLLSSFIFDLLIFLLDPRGSRSD